MILVLGPTGQVGSAVMRIGDDAVAVGRSILDLGSAERADIAELLDRLHPEVVINCAAYTAVDRAESEEALASRVNGVAVGLLASECASRGVRFVTFSTDYVFKGAAEVPYRETDPVDPINAYGRSKLMGERLALEYPETCLVVRTSWVVSGTHPNFVATMLRLAATGRPFRVVADQRGRPTVAEDLASATMSAVQAGVTGLLHLANEGPTTWFELAREAVQMAGMSPELIDPCTTEEYPTPAARPAFSVLDTTLAASSGISLPHWRTSLAGVVQEQSSTPE